MKMQQYARQKRREQKTHFIDESMKWERSIRFLINNNNN